MRTIINDWLTDPSFSTLLAMREHAGKDMDRLERMITLAEVDSIVFSDNPSFHYLLATTYQQLPQELSLEAKRAIEREKQRELETGYACDISHTMDASALKNGNTPVSRSLQDSFISIGKMSSEEYLSQGNVNRAVLHYMDGIRKSTGDPEPYDLLVKTIGASFLLDLRFVNVFPYVSSFLRENWKD